MARGRKLALILAPVALGFAVGAALARQDPIIRTDTRLVEVRVAAYDSKGQPIAGLTREDFHVLDSGEERPIALFSAEVPAPSANAPAIPGSPTPTSTAPTPPARARDDSAIIFLDWLNTSLPDRIRAFECTEKLLETFQPNQKTAIYSLSNDGLRMVHQFTAATDLLLDALHDEGFDGYSASNQPVGAGPDWGTSGMRFLQLDGRIRQAINSMIFLGDRLSHMPGRKSLIWVSDGFPSSVGGFMIGSPRAPTANYVTQIEKIVRALNSANIAVYSIDAEGLPAGGYPTSSLTPGPETMSELSQRTGGTMFSGRNDLDAGIRAALEDINVSYTLGFAVPERTIPGEHAIEVRTNRRRLVLRYRESYTLDAPGKGARR